MSDHNPRFIEVSTLEKAKNEILKIGSDPKSIDIMAPKAILKIIKLEKIKLQDAIIIKQDMLSVGGEVAIPKDAFELKEKTADILIFGTVKQLFDLVEKLNRHYLRIRNVSKELESLLKSII